MTNPHPTGSDASATDEMVEAAVRAYFAEYFVLYLAVTPDDIIKLTNKSMRAALTAALSFPTPKGKHIEDVYPDEAVAWRWWDTTGYSSTLDANIAAQVRSRGFIVEPLFTVDPPQLLAAKQQGMAEERERCAKIAEADAAASKSNWENARGSEKAYHLWAEQAATGIASAIRGAS